MKRRTITFILTLVLLISALVYTTEDVSAMRYYGNTCVFNCKSYVSLKKSAKSSSKTLCKIPYGKYVTWCYGQAKKNGYYLVDYNGKTGWIPAKYCTWKGEVIVYECYKVVNSTKITLRKKKSTSSKKITTIPNGAVVFSKTYNLSGKKWVSIKYKNKTGYVQAKYLKQYDAYLEPIPAMIGRSTYGSLQEAINDVQEGETIEITRDIDMGKKTLTLNKNISYTIDLSGHTISNIGAINVEKGNVYIKNGSIKIATHKYGKHCSLTNIHSNAKLEYNSIKYTGSIDAASNSKVTLKGGTYRNTYIYNNSTNTFLIDSCNFPSIYCIMNDGTMDINKGNFTFLGAEDSGWAILNGGEKNGTLNIYGGSFIFKNGSFVESYKTLRVASSLYTTFKNVLELSGGTFTKIY